MTTCTGCNPMLEVLEVPYSVPLINPTGGPQRIATVPIYGNGVGSFSGVTGYYMGQLDFYVGSAVTGICTGFSGRLELVSATQSGTGAFTFNSQFNCTGFRPCASTIQQVFRAATNQIPGSPAASGTTAHFIMYNSEGYSNHAIGTGMTGQDLIHRGYSFSAECGEADYIFNIFRVLIAPYSGWIGAEKAYKVYCAPCVTG